MKSFCISLEKNKDKWSEITEKIKKAGFQDIEMFPAIKGTDIQKLYLNEPAPEEISYLVDSLGGKRMISTWGKYILQHKKSDRRHDAQLTNWGAVGCYLSHILIWIRMIEEDMPYCVIFEDDISFTDNFTEKFDKGLRDVPEDADAIFLGVVHNSKPIRYNERVNRIGAVFYGLHGYIMTNKGARKFLKNAFPIEVQLDSNMSFTAVLEGMNLYDIHGLCNQTIHVSSIQNPCIVCNINEIKARAIILMLLLCLIVFTIVAIKMIRS